MLAAIPQFARTDSLQALRSPWFPALVALFAGVAVSLSATCRFGFGREQEMLAEMGSATLVVSWFFLSAFSAAEIFSKSAPVRDLLLSRPLGAVERMAGALAGVLLVSFFGGLLVAHGVTAASFLLEGRGAVGGMLAVFVVLALAVIVRRVRRESPSAKELAIFFLVLLFPCGLWFWAPSTRGNVPSYLGTTLIFGTVEGILITGLCLLSQATVPGIGGIILSFAAFFAGSMKGFLFTQTMPGSLEQVLKVVLVPVPNFQAISAAGRIDPSFSLCSLLETCIYVLLFGAGLFGIACRMFAGSKADNRAP